MNEIQQGLLVLIKSAVDKQPMALPEGFSMDAAEKQIYRHQIVGLAYEGAVLCGISQQDPVMVRLFQKYYQQILRNQKQTAALNKLFETFDANGIDYLPVKGLDMKALYPDPAMRTMGDADVLIRMEQYDRIKPLMLELGYTEGKQTGHELIWDCPALYLELHRQLMSSYHSDLQKYYGDGWKLAKPLTGNRYTYSLEDMYIFLFAHFVKHYRRAGIGLRHVLDIWLFRENNPTLDHDYVQREMESLHLNEFHKNICSLIDYWFKGAKADEKIEFISEFIFTSGSWGSHANHMRFVALREKKMQEKNHTSKKSAKMELLFPSKKNMVRRYPILHKLPWLLPFLWPVRWVTVLLFRHDSIRKAQNNVKYQTKKEVDQYDEDLSYVGLHYEG